MKDLEVIISSIKDDIVSFSFVVEKIRFISSVKTEICTVAKPSIKEVLQVSSKDDIKKSLRDALHFTELRFLVKELNDQLRNR